MPAAWLCPTLVNALISVRMRASGSAFLRCGPVHDDGREVGRTLGRGALELCCGLPSAPSEPASRANWPPRAGEVTGLRRPGSRPII